MYYKYLFIYLFQQLFMPLLPCLMYGEASEGQHYQIPSLSYRDSKSVLVSTSTLFSGIKFTQFFQLSVLSFMNRKDLILIFLLPCRKEKRAHPSPVEPHHLPMCPEPSTDGFGAGGGYWELGLFSELQKVGWVTQREVFLEKDFIMHCMSAHQKITCHQPSLGMGNRKR